jgi:hypothetical protein
MSVFNFLAIAEHKSKIFCPCSSVRYITQAFSQEVSAIHIVLVIIAPLVLEVHNVCIGKSLTSFKLFKEQLQEKYTYKEDSVVVDGWYTFASA